MSSGIGFFELFLLFVIGLLILGPEKLPRVASQIGRWVGRARRTANQLRYQLEREITLADIEKDSKHKKPPNKPSEKKSGEEESSDKPDEQSSASGSQKPEETIAGSSARNDDVDEKADK